MKKLSLKLLLLSLLAFSGCITPSRVEKKMYKDLDFAIQMERIVDDRWPDARFDTTWTSVGWPDTTIFITKEEDTVGLAAWNAQLEEIKEQWRIEDSIAQENKDLFDGATVLAVSYGIYLHRFEDTLRIDLDPWVITALDKAGRPPAIKVKTVTITRVDTVKTEVEVLRKYNMMTEFAAVKTKELALKTNELKLVQQKNKKNSALVVATSAIGILISVVLLWLLLKKPKVLS